MNLREKILQKASGAMGINMYRFDSMQTAGGAWWDSGDEDGIKRKGVYTDAFWLAPPYGRPRDIDYDRLEAIEKSVWVRMCVQHIVDRIAGADWNIVPMEKGDDVPQEHIDKPKEFFNSMTWDKPLSHVIRMLLPDAIQYDAGVILKSYPVIAYEKENWRLKSTQLPPLQLYARDGRSFMMDTNLFGQVKTYWQYSWINPQGKPIEFSPDEIIYFQKSPMSRGPYGIAALEIIEEIIDYMIDSTLAQSKYWKNGLFVGGQIDLPDVRDLDELKRQQAYFEAKLRGPRKYNKWIVTGGGAKVQSMPFTSQQMQFIDSQKWFAKMVFAVFELTPSELGFTEDLNKATGIQQMEIHKSAGIRPWLKLIEDMFNRHVVWSDFTDDVKFEFRNELDLADRNVQTDIDIARLGAGLDSVNELRMRDGLDSWDDEKYNLPTGDAEPPDEDLDYDEDDEMGWESMFDDVDVTKGGPGSGVKGHTTQVSITVESKIKRLKTELADHKRKTEEHYKEGEQLPNSPERNKWHDKWAQMKKKEHILSAELEKSIAFLKEKEKKKKKAKKKPTKSFSEHLLSHTDKAARVGALSGTPGFVPKPPAYDGMKKPIKTKKLEDKSLKEVMDWLEELKKKAQTEVDRLYSGET